jgi:hypothetical protein
VEHSGSGSEGVVSEWVGKVKQRCPALLEWIGWQPALVAVAWQGEARMAACLPDRGCNGRTRVAFQRRAWHTANRSQPSCSRRGAAWIDGSCTLPQRLPLEGQAPARAPAAITLPHATTSSRTGSYIHSIPHPNACMQLFEQAQSADRKDSTRASSII